MAGKKDNRTNSQEKGLQAENTAKKANKGLVELPYEDPLAEIDKTADGNLVERKATNDFRMLTAKNLNGMSPKEIDDLIGTARTKFASIYAIPYKWLEKRLKNYLLSLYVPIKEKAMVSEQSENGNWVERWTGEWEVVGYKYADVPTKSGIAKAIGVTVATLTKYLSKKDDYAAFQNYTDPNKPNFKPVPNPLKEMGDMGLKQQRAYIREQQHKFQLIEMVYGEYVAFHEKRMGLNENVSGSIFALLNANQGWSNKQEVEHSVSESLLGRMKSKEELEEMAHDLPDFNDDVELGSFDD